MAENWQNQYTTGECEVWRCVPGFPVVKKNMPTNAGDVRDLGSIPEFGRSPGGGHGNPQQYSCLENPMDRGAWQATVQWVEKSWTWLKQLSAHARVCLYACVLTHVEETPMHEPRGDFRAESGSSFSPFQQKGETGERLTSLLLAWESGISGTTEREYNPWAWNLVLAIKFISVWYVTVYYGFVWGWIRWNTLNPSQPSAYENIGLDVIPR